MPSVFDAIQKRSACPVAGLEGVFLRELTYGETRRVRSLKGDDDRSAFVIGLSVVNGNGDREWSQITGEIDSEFASRVLASIDTLTPATIHAISEEIERLMKPVNVDKLQKKSAEITSPASPVISPPPSIVSTGGN